MIVSSEGLGLNDPSWRSLENFPGQGSLYHLGTGTGGIDESHGPSISLSLAKALSSPGTHRGSPEEVRNARKEAAVKGIDQSYCDLFEFYTELKYI